MRAREIQPQDPQMTKLRQKLRTHYGQFRQDPEQQFDKWVARAIQHSEEQDAEHDQEIAKLKRDQQALQKKLK